MKIIKKLDNGNYLIEASVEDLNDVHSGLYLGVGEGFPNSPSDERLMELASDVDVAKFSPDTSAT